MRVITWAAAVAALPLSAMAQEAVPLEGVVVTTSKTPKKAIDTPSASSSVGSGSARRQSQQTAAPPAEAFPVSGVSIDGFGANGKSQFDKIQPASVTDMLRDVPGVTTSIAPNDPAQSINIRGLQDFGRVNVLVDGARQNFQRSGHNANGSFYLEPEFISSIDITRGPSSNVFGSGAIGGVAAFNTKGVDDILRPDENAAIMQKTGFGTNGAGYLSSTSGGLRVGPNVDFYGQLVERNQSTYENGDGVRILDSASEDIGGLGKVAIRPAPGHEITGSALIQRYDFVNGVGTTSAPRRDTDVQADTYTLGYTYRPAGNPLLDLSAKAYYTTTVTDQKQLNITPTRFRSFDIETTGFDISNTSRFNTGALRHRVTYGGDFFEDRVVVEDIFSTADLFTPSGKRSIWGTFIEDEVQITPWARAIGAIRYDNFEAEASGRDLSKEGDRVSPKGTLAVTPLTGIELFGTYAEGYRAPALTETIIAGQHPNFGPGSNFTFLPNLDIDPEVGKTKEFGVNLKYDSVFQRGDKLRGKIAVFRNDVSDYIDLVVVNPSLGCPPPFCVQYQNIAQARVEGLEVELGYDWGRGFANIAGTINSTENRETGRALLSHQPDRLSTTLGFRFLNDRLIAGTRVHFVDASDRDAVQGVGGFAPTLLPTDGYVLWDLFGSYQFNDWSALDIALNNVTDVDYRKYLDQDDSAGFQARAALTVKFGDKTGPLSNW